MGHEMTHVVDHNNSNYKLWNNYCGKDYRKDMAETRAYEWQLSIGGDFSADDKEYYNFYKNRLNTYIH